MGLRSCTWPDADVLPYDYRLYGREIVGYVEAAQRKAAAEKLKLDFAAARAAAARFEAAGTAVRAKQAALPAKADALNKALRQAEGALLDPAGLPTAPGTSTRSTLQESLPGTPQWSFRA